MLFDLTLATPALVGYFDLIPTAPASTGCFHLTLAATATIGRLTCFLQHILGKKLSSEVQDEG